MAADGTGTHKTIQQAVDAAPQKRRIAFLHPGVKPGSYREKLVVQKNKGPITLFGEEAKSTILTYDDFAAKRDEHGEEIGMAEEL